jgi:hypothetical protein
MGAAPRQLQGDRPAYAPGSASDERQTPRQGLFDRRRGLRHFGSGPSRGFSWFFAKAFSSEVDAGSHEEPKVRVSEYTSKQNEPPIRFDRIGG